jgi:hypothetical protein
MGLFSKKPKVEVCEMCGKSEYEGCGTVHNHVEQISADTPAWLPYDYRAQAPGEFTWLCARCNAFPAMKWPSDHAAVAGMQLHLGKDHHVGMFASGGTPVPFSMIGARPQTTEPAPPPAASPAQAPDTAEVAPPAAPATSEEEMTKEMAYSLATMAREASRLYEECIDKADQSDRARVMSQTDYVNGVQQHPISKQSFANMASRLEGQLINLLQTLHELSARGRGMWSDFMFLAGGPKSDAATAMQWCTQHNLDSDTISAIAVDGLFLRCDFGLTRESFLEENQRLSAAMEANQ